MKLRRKKAFDASCGRDFARVPTDYYAKRAALGSLHSKFHCQSGCSRPGCNNVNMHVAITVFDIAGVALQARESTLKLYRRNYCLGILPHPSAELLCSVSLKARKPCAYLEADGRCGIYPLRPVSCMLFPEAEVVDDTLGVLRSRPEFKDYLCVQSLLEVSRERMQTIRALQWLHNCEVLISDFYLFGNAGYWVDFTGLMESLPAAEGIQPHELHGHSEGQTKVLPFDTLERTFALACRECTALTGIEERVEELNRRDSQEQLFYMLTDQKLLRKLYHMKSNRASIIQFKRGKARVKQRSLLEREHIFVW